jgi:hypothetical protein
MTAGFLMAIAAAGDDLTRFTVLAEPSASDRLWIAERDRNLFQV